MKKKSVADRVSTIVTHIGFGEVLAMVISYCHWHSIPWALLHGFFGWVYVIYHYLKY